MKRRIVSVLVFGACLMHASASVAANSSPATAAQQLRQVQSTAFESRSGRALVDAITDFGFTVHAANGRANQNVATSPLSLMSAFATAANGAKGATLQQMMGALKLGPMKKAELDAGYQAVRQSLGAISSASRLALGNAVFTDNDFVIRPSFLQTVQRTFAGSAATVNFEKPEEAAAQINRYIEDQTDGQITKMLDPSLIRGWRIAMVNATYFKGSWVQKFPVDRTDEKASFRTGRDVKTVPMMSQARQMYLYHRGDGFQMVSLPYANSDFAFDLIVPDLPSGRSPEQALATVATQLTNAKYRQWIAQSVPTRVTLGLPRFEVEFKIDLSDYFKGVMPIAFSDGADFGMFSTEQIKLDRVIHAVKLQVTEAGTVGAAASIVSGVRTAEFPERPVARVVADHPFLFVIRHVQSGTPIFVGTIWDPKPLPRVD